MLSEDRGRPSDVGTWDRFKAFWGDVPGGFRYALGIAQGLSISPKKTAGQPNRALPNRALLGVIRLVKGRWPGRWIVFIGGWEPRGGGEMEGH